MPQLGPAKIPRLRRDRSVVPPAARLQLHRHQLRRRHPQPAHRAVVTALRNKEHISQLLLKFIRLIRKPIAPMKSYGLKNLFSVAMAFSVLGLTPSWACGLKQGVPHEHFQDVNSIGKLSYWF